MVYILLISTGFIVQGLSMMIKNLVTKVVLPLPIVKYLLSCQHILVWLIPLITG